MKFLLGVLLFLATLFLLWLFAMKPRYGQRRLEALRQYRYTHRGLHNMERGVPENSMLAFRYAVAGGFGTELDVRLTKDRQLVVIHDSWLDRMCGVHLRVEEQTLDQLRELRLQGTKERIPLLADVLQLFCGKAPVIIELKVEKGNYRALCEKTCRLLESYRGDFCVESFDPRVLRWLKKNEPFIIRGQLSQNFMKGSEIPEVSLPIRLMQTLLLSNIATRPDFVAFRYEDRQLLSVQLCCGLLKAPEVSWTIRSQADMEAAERNGAMVIFERFLPGKTGAAVETPVVETPVVEEPAAEE